MALEAVKKASGAKKIFFGSILVLACNFIYIGNSYIVAWAQLKASEITLVKGILQLLIFGAANLFTKKEKNNNNKEAESGSKSNRFHLLVLLCILGFTTATASFAVLTAIPLMPIGDVIVICFTAPVFSVFLDRIVLHKPLSFLSIFLCLFIVVGDILVVQPPFLFNKDSSNLKEEKALTEKHGELYFTGVALCFYTALSSAIANVVSTQCFKKSITTSNIMMVIGSSFFLLSIISTIFLPNRLITNPQIIPLKEALFLPVSAFMVMTGFWLMTLAISITGQPTLVTMLRSTEILISIVTESLWWGQMPGFLSIVGSLLVTFCVLGMAAKEDIEKMVERRRNNQKSNLVSKEDIIEPV